MQPLFFVHIPKTAGTSFRLGAQQYFLKERVVYDYGIRSAETSQLTHDCLYNGRVDPWRFKCGCKQQNVAMVGGHVGIGRFVSLFGACNTLTFLRDPLQRTASEYAHFVRNYGYEGSFYDFYSRQNMHNRQNRLLRGAPLEAIGFVGLTEHYAESLAMLNARYSSDIPHRKDNRDKSRLSAGHCTSAEDEAEFNRLNRQDLALYERARVLFKTRLALFRDGLPYAHARVQEVTRQHVTGWAWWAAAGDEPVGVEVWVNGTCAGTVPAVDLRPGLCRLHPPRGGHVGFRLPLKLTPGDQVQCRVADTGQRFPFEPCKVPEPKTE